MISVECQARPISPSPCLSATTECVVFALCAQTYAVAAASLRTCLSLPRLTALDDTPAYLVGAFDLRGELAPVISPAALDGSTLPPAASRDLLIVVDAGGHPLALHADTMLGIEPLSAPSSHLRHLPPWKQRLASVGSGVQVSLSGGEACYIDPSLIELVADISSGTTQSADERLWAFERELDTAALALLETRAERYRGLPRVGQSRRAWRTETQR